MMIKASRNCPPPSWSPNDGQTLSFSQELYVKFHPFRKEDLTYYKFKGYRYFKGGFDQVTTTWNETTSKYRFLESRWICGVGDGAGRQCQMIVSISHPSYLCQKRRNAEIWRHQSVALGVNSIPWLLLLSFIINKEPKWRALADGDHILWRYLYRLCSRLDFLLNESTGARE